MIVDILILFIVITVILFFVSVFMMEDRPSIAIPFIMLGMIFCILCAYGMWDVETIVVGYNSTLGNTSTEIYSTMDYGEPYSFVFVFFFFTYVVLFFRCGWNMWKEALKTEGEMDFGGKKRW